MNTSTSNHGTISSLSSRKCPNWKLWAYTDGSCIGKAKNFLGAGVYCPQNQSWMLCELRRRGNDKHHHRAELTGIAAALIIKYTKIATDSACSLSQIRKLLISPEMQQDHIHSNLLKQIVSMIYASSAFIKWKPIVALPEMNVQMQLPNTLPYMTEVMTCIFSLQLQTVIHTPLLACG